MADPRVVVVGAGIAGLAAARRLAARGFRVTVCERAGRPGGRARGGSERGFTLEAGAGLVSDGDRGLLAWIHELGLRDELLPLRPVVEARLQGGRPRAIDPRDWPGIARIPGIALHEALRLLRLPRLLRRYRDRLDPRDPARAAPLDDRSLADFGRLYFGASVLSQWMGPAVAADSLGGVEETSRVLFLLEQAARARERPGLLRAPLGELLDAAAAGLRIHCETACTSIAPAGGRGLALALASADGRAPASLEADAVVVATPAPAAAALTAPLGVPAERDGLAAVRYAPCLVLCVALRRAFSPHPRRLRFPAPEGSACESLLLEPGVAGGRVPRERGLAVLRATAAWSEARAGAPDDAVGKELLAELERVVPDAGAAVLFTRVVREPQAFPRFDVGRYRQLARFAAVQGDRRRAGRRLYFAGDYLVAPSWEGALVSGWRAAEAVERDLG